MKRVPLHLFVCSVISCLAQLFMFLLVAKSGIDTGQLVLSAILVVITGLAYRLKGVQA